MPARRVGQADGGVEGFRLPSGRIPDPLTKGMRGWRTSEDWMVLRLHYSADPARASDEWRAQQVKGYRGGFEGRDWRREMEIDFSAYKGEPVYPQFDAAISVRPTRWNPHLPLWRGWDFGYRHPAVLWAQLWPPDAHNPMGTLVILHELYPTLNSDSVPGIKTGDLAKLVLAETADRFPGAGDDAPVLDFVDPSGNQTKETSDYSSIEIIEQHNIMPEWSVVGRKNRIEYLRPYVEGGTACRINPHCVLTIKAFSAAYRYPEERAGGSDREMPDTGKKVQSEPYIHLMDAIEYIAACNLQVNWEYRPGSKKAHDESKRVGELAELYLGANNRADDRMALSDPVPVHAELEQRLEDLIGDYGDLENAWAQPSL